VSEPIRRRYLDGTAADNTMIETRVSFPKSSTNRGEPPFRIAMP